MLSTTGLTVIRFILPFFIFSSSLSPGLNHHGFLGLFGKEYEMRYDQCTEQTAQQQEVITQLKVSLGETEVKLRDVDIFRDSLEQRESVLKDREESLKKRENDLKLQAQSLDKKMLEFTQKVEKVARDGGKVEQIIANNEMLSSRIQSLERRLDTERQIAREDLESERVFFDDRIKEERGINSKLQQSMDRNSQFMLVVEAVFLIIIFTVIAALVALYMNWRKGNIVPTQNTVIEIDKRSEEPQSKQLLSGKSSDDSADLPAGEPSSE